VAASGHGMAANDYDRFYQWLASQNKTKCTAREIIIYSKKYGYVLDNGDASYLLSLSPTNRRHAMTALASLSSIKEDMTNS
jgi:hypothetical protein